MDTTLKELLNKLHSGKITEAEIDQLLETFQKGELQSLEQEMKKDWNTTEEDPQEEKKLIWEKLQAKLKAEQIGKVRRIRKHKRQNLLKYAAVFLGVLLTTALIFQDRILSESAPEDRIQVTLELTDGEVELLDSAQPQVAEESGYRYEEDKLVYSKQQSTVEEVSYHTIHIPNGRRFHLFMADGTEIHLNSGSSLKYPVNFIEGQPREVNLKGEAYFQVASNGDEFIVNTNGLTTEVLGTEFNVMSHPEEKLTEVVLLEGSVRVSAAESHTLKPDQKLSYDPTTDSLMVEEVEAADYISWVYGELVFRNERFSEIVSRMERHYDVKITNTNQELKDKRFTGRFRNENVQEVLEIFQIATDFSYEIKDKDIHIKELKTAK